MGLLQQIEQWRRRRRSARSAPKWMRFGLAILILAVAMIAVAITPPGAGLTYRTAQAIGQPISSARPLFEADWQVLAFVGVAAIGLSTVIVFITHWAAGRVLARQRRCGPPSD